MTSGYDEAHREIESTVAARRVWRVAVDGVDVQRRIEVGAPSAGAAIEAAKWRGVFDGVEIYSISIEEVRPFGEQR